jgi:hypothetical protein
LEFIGDAEMPNAPMSMKLFPRIWDTLRIMQGTPNLAAMRAAEAVLSQDGILGIFRGACAQAPAGHSASGSGFHGAAPGVPILPLGTFSEDDWNIFDTLRKNTVKPVL